jgi:hypothetical protein
LNFQNKLPHFYYFAEKIAIYDNAPDQLVFRAAKITQESSLSMLTQDPSATVKDLSPWLRLMVESSCLSEESKCLEVVKQALQLMKTFSSGSERAYPEQEIEWLMNRLWTLGIHYEE